MTKKLFQIMLFALVGLGARPCWALDPFATEPTCENLVNYNDLPGPGVMIVKEPEVYLTRDRERLELATRLCQNGRPYVFLARYLQRFGLRKDLNVPALVVVDGQTLRSSSEVLRAGLAKFPNDTKVQAQWLAEVANDPVELKAAVAQWPASKQTPVWMLLALSNSFKILVQRPQALDLLQRALAVEPDLDQAYAIWLDLVRHGAEAGPFLASISASAARSNHPCDLGALGAANPWTKACVGMENRGLLVQAGLLALATAPDRGLALIVKGLGTHGNDPKVLRRDPAISAARKQVSRQLTALQRKSAGQAALLLTDLPLTEPQKAILTELVRP